MSGFSNRNGRSVAPGMQKRHFALIAETIASMPVSRGARAALADHFADALADTNENFHREHFIAVAMGKKAPTSMPYRPRTRRVA